MSREKAVEAVVAAGEDPEDAEQFVRNLDAALPYLVADLSSPPASLLTQHQGGKIYRYPLTEVVDEEPE